MRRRGLPLAIASSSDYGVIDAVVARLGIAEDFRAVHSGQDERLGKPHPAIFLGAARKLGIAPDLCVAFEDSPGGVAAAKAAGMICVAVPDGAGAPPAALAAERERLAAEADLLIDSLAELDDALWRRIEAAQRSASPCG